MDFLVDFKFADIIIIDKTSHTSSEKKAGDHMLDIRLFETIFDNLTDGLYVLDHAGNFIFVNSAYSQLLNMPKSVLYQYNVHDFLSTGQIDICISDIVYKQKRRVIMFQDVIDTQNFGRNPIRQMVISTPIFDETGEVSHILALVRPNNQMTEFQAAAEKEMHTLQISDVPAIRPNRFSEDIIFSSKAMENVFEIASHVAKVDSTVLLTGESGTGKEVVSRFLYEQSNRKDGPYVVVNCPSISEHLLESELFGYEKGAFTGASSKGKKGLIEEADGGTLFLDEINSLPLDFQGKILRALENKTIQRVGSTKNINVDFRLIAATNENLAELVEQKKFRADLYYRINVVPIHIPPLRARKEDIIPLALYFLDIFCKKYGKNKVFTDHTLEQIRNYSWPGNVRQLRNLVEHAVVMNIDDLIEITDIEQFTSGNVMSHPTQKKKVSPVQESADLKTDPEISISLQDYVDQCEKQYIEKALAMTGSTYKAAELLKTSQSSIMRKKRKYGLGE